eukprot:PRCOL_00006245-RA
MDEFAGAALGARVASETAAAGEAIRSALAAAAAEGAAVPPLAAGAGDSPVRESERLREEFEAVKREVDAVKSAIADVLDEDEEGEREPQARDAPGAAGARDAGLLAALRARLVGLRERRTALKAAPKKLTLRDSSSFDELLGAAPRARGGMGGAFERREVVRTPARPTSKLIPLDECPKSGLRPAPKGMPKGTLKGKAAGQPQRRRLQGRGAGEGEEDAQPRRGTNVGGRVLPGGQGGRELSGGTWDKLLDYQRTCVTWLWELHCQGCGGIVGDEMGLGKTVQMASFLGGLHRSGKYKPSIIVCPATILRQWLRELRTWHPAFKVAILHRSAGEHASTAAGVRALVARVARSADGVLVTTYEQLRIHAPVLLGVPWGYAVLDEGHKIRNPDAAVTLVCKQLRTVHRIAMTGAPVQNNLTELWSVFDFVFPGRLGTLPVFQAQFALPIQVGGYATATRAQAAAAYKCAVLLRDMISPYLLRRVKADVRTNLPKKTEQVLFCLLGREQRDLYRSFLASDEMDSVLQGRRQALYAIDALRKICNHPDLLERASAQHVEGYGAVARSGKLGVLASIMRRWREAGRRALIFSQTRQVLDIIEAHAAAGGYSYRRMDGTTPVGARGALVDEYNGDDSIFAFLLTTKVGGLGVNLTGADRVLVFDPDWNPSTDAQARERAWRIGQRKEVTVYRLITSGTIEEKIYHRQVYKQLLTDRVLKDPKQRRLFKAKDIRDLFTLGDEYNDAGAETAAIFADGAADVEVHRDEGGDGSDEDGAGASGNGGAGDEGLLAGLLSNGDAEKAKSGVGRVLNHDAMVAAGHDADGDASVRARAAAARAEADAAAVAARAEAALRASREAPAVAGASRPPPGAAAAAPPLSAGSLLARMRARAADNGG